MTPTLAWKRADLSPADWLIPIDQDCLQNLRAIVQALRNQGGSVTELDLGALELDAAQSLMARARAKLDQGPGFAILDRVPVGHYATEENRAIGWTLANLIGRVVDQKWTGTPLYDVRDRGKIMGHGVRRSITNLEQEFHTDGGWLGKTPEYAGLFCIQPAAQGGNSRLSSLVAAHNDLADQPETLNRLYQPFYWDRQAEHDPQDSMTSHVPVFWKDGDRIFARYYDDYIRKGHEIAKDPLDQPALNALDSLKHIIDDAANWIEFRLEPGQFLYVNNRQIAHSRTAFQDHGAQRHLMRFWNRDEGGATLEG